MIPFIVAVGAAGFQQPASSGPASLPAYIYIPGKTYYHRGSCKLIEGRQDLEPATPAIIKRESLKPCLICCRPVTTSQATTRLSTSRPADRSRIVHQTPRDDVTVKPAPDERRQTRDQRRTARMAGRQFIPADQARVGMTGRFGPPYYFVVYQIIGPDDMVVEVHRATAQVEGTGDERTLPGGIRGILWVSGIPTGRFVDGKPAKLPGVFKITRSVMCPTLDGEGVSISVAEPLR